MEFFLSALFQIITFTAIVVNPYRTTTKIPLKMARGIVDPEIWTRV